MKLNELRPVPGSRHRQKRVGRGPGSGHGKTATRGHKGQKARAGSNKGSRSFEGGQIPFIRKIPKRGFTPIRRREYQIVNLEQLNRFKDGEVIDSRRMREGGLIKNRGGLVKILAKGEIKRKLTVRADKFSRKAIEAISKIGGKTNLTTDKDILGHSGRSEESQ
ncbi:MAG: 50S ribosomal protein L15 [Candidatus Omnitrophica bacterium]|nr:50S ribosomal protein L15 [Candidatus Omnitrophota bacterium]